MTVWLVVLSADTFGARHLRYDSWHNSALVLFPDYTGAADACADLRAAYPSLAPFPSPASQSQLEDSWRDIVSSTWAADSGYYSP